MLFTSKHLLLHRMAISRYSIVLSYWELFSIGIYLSQGSTHGHTSRKTISALETKYTPHGKDISVNHDFEGGRDYSQVEVCKFKQRLPLTRHAKSWLVRNLVFDQSAIAIQLHYIAILGPARLASVEERGE